MLSASLGKSHVGEWPQWNFACHAWQNEGSTATLASHSTRPRSPASPMAECGHSTGWLGLACANEEWPRRAFEPKEAASEGSQAVRGPSVCPLQPATHIPYAPGR